MTTTTLGKHLSAKDERSFTSYLAKKLGRIEEHLVGLPQDALHLRATCEKFPTNAAFKLILELHADGERYYVTDDHHSITEVVDMAIDKLEHQLRSSRDKAQGKEKRTRGARRSMKTSAEDAEPDPAASSSADRAQIFQALQPLLPGIHANLRKEIASLESARALAPRRLTPEAVIDTLVIDLYDHFGAQPDGLSFEQWVGQRATYFLNTMAREEGEVNGRVHLTEFYQPSAA